MRLLITNTLSGQREDLKPNKGNRVTMYVCGITPYDYAHIGHGRCYVVFDLLYRVLTFLGYEVIYCRNFTDIDDKILNRAERELGDRNLYTQIANRFIASFNQDMEALGNIKPDIEPRVTQTIPEIIEFISKLIEKGVAYTVAGDVYYYVPSFSAYGQLSKRTLSELYPGVRVAVNDIKKSPYDFALWKAEADGTFWKSPWGYGRPGWHIECSAMSEKYLHYPIDIHGGGMDLIFPHHENEIAQSCGLYKDFVRYWVHSAFVTANKEKMSKSLGNFFTLNDIFKQYDPMVLRYYLVSHYFRAPLEFSHAEMDACKKTYQRLITLCHDHVCESCNDPFTVESIQDNQTVLRMMSFILDDLNVSGALGIVFEELHAIRQDVSTLCSVKKLLQQILGLTLTPLEEKTIDITPEMQRLIQEREQARKVKDWQRADALRDQLMKLGYQIHDTKLR